MGCLSISNDFHKASQNFLVTYLEENHLDTELAPLVRPFVPFPRNEALIKQHYRNFQITDLNSVQELIDLVEEDQMRIPVLLRHYLKMGSKVLGFNVDPNFSNVLDVLIYTDLTQSPEEMMKKYLGESGYNHWILTQQSSSFSGNK
jgi:hypothetical protein